MRPNMIFILICAILFMFFKIYNTIELKLMNVLNKCLKNFKAS